MIPPKIFNAVVTSNRNCIIFPTLITILFDGGGGGAVVCYDLVDHSAVSAAVAGRTGVVAPVERLVPATGYMPHAHARTGLPRIAVARENRSV